MAYGKILVDQVENSDGKSLNVGPSARVFDTVTDLQASTTLADGDIVIVKERANAEYEIQSSAYTALEGDLTLTSGQIAELQLKPINDLRWWGVVADYDFDTKSGTDNAQAVMNAISRGDGYTTIKFQAPSDAWVGIGESIIIDRGFVDIEGCFAALSTFDPGTVDLDAMNTSDSTGRTNRGNPMFKVWESNESIGYDVELEYRQINLDIKIDGANICPGISFEKCFNSQHRIEAFHCSYYGVAYQVKNGQCRNYNSTIAEYWWGEDGHTDPDLRTARNFIIGCPDIIVDNLISYYCIWPLYVENGNVQVNSPHLYGGYESGYGAYVSGSGASFSNVYMDGVSFHCYKTQIAIVGGLQLGGTDLPLVYVYATEEDQALQGMVIQGVRGNSSAAQTLTLVEDETNNYLFTSIVNSKVDSLAKDNTGTNRESYLTGKFKVVNIEFADWVANGDIYEYELDIDDMICVKNSLYSYCLVPTMTTNLSTFDPTSESLLHNVNYKYIQSESTTLTVYSNIARKMQLTINYNEGNFS